MFIVLQVADFPLQAALRLSSSEGLSLLAGDPSGTPPAYLTQPAALFSGTTKKSVALAVNAPARAAGVETGMSAPQAIARCATLLIRTPVPDAETEARAALLAAAFTVSPHVEITAPGVVTLAAHGLAPPARVPACEAALARIAQIGLFATAGLARTPLLAHYAARATPGASAVREIQPTDESRFLARLPLDTAEPSTELAGVLHAWGLRTLGDLTALPRNDVGRRLGSAGTALWDRARGGEARPLHLVALPQQFVAEREFEEALETLEPLLFILRRFLDRLALELEAAHFVAVELDLTLTLAGGLEHARSFRLPEPTRDPTILFRTLHTHLESVRTDSPIVAVRLRVVSGRPLVRQHGLFETGLRDPHGFAETLARLSALLGAERVGAPHCDDTHRPDAVRVMPPPAVVPPVGPPPVQQMRGRPLRRFRPPLPARFEVSASHPSVLWTERAQGTIVEQRGPWLSSGEWWQSDRAWARAEWDIALAEGGTYRVFRTPEGWFLEGEYD
jgi:protein ImuB